MNSNWIFASRGPILVPNGRKKLSFLRLAVFGSGTLVKTQRRARLPEILAHPRVAEAARAAGLPVGDVASRDLTVGRNGPKRAPTAGSHARHSGAICVHNMHACILCIHNMHAYYACMHIKHAYYACIICMHAGMHAYYAGILCMHSCCELLSG